jgi:hypothetical protein
MGGKIHKQERLMAKYEVSDEKEDMIQFYADGTAIVYKKSVLTGIMHKTVLPITPDQMIAWKQQRRLIQDVFPRLSNEEREFLMTGSTPEEWNKEFKDDDNGQQNIS